MIQSKIREPLPKHWIVVRSKSFPTKVYYFNVKTGEKRWTNPVNDDPPEVENKETRKTRKRRMVGFNDSDVGDESRATTPEYEHPKRSVKKRKLVSKRKNVHEYPPGDASCQGSSTDSSISDDLKSPIPENETPLMKEIRLKLLARKSKAAIKVPTPSPPKQKVDSENTNDAFKKPQIPLSMPKIKSIETQETFTPQMKTIYEKLKCKNPNLVLKKNDGPTLPSKQNIESSQSIEIESKNPKDIAKKIIKQPTRLETRQSGRKNIAAERMSKLRKELQAKTKPNKSPIVRDKPLVVKNSSNHVKKSEKIDSLPSVYTNYKNRLERLRNRVISNNHININNKDNEDSSQPENNPTVEMRVKNAVQAAFCEEMDWEPIEERILHEIQFVRTHICANGTSNFEQPILETNNLQLLPQPSLNKTLYIVVDTNVFLTNLKKVEEIRDIKYKSYGRPVIVIPWTVLRELDYIKDDKSNTKLDTIRQEARKAINFLNEHFSSKHPRVVAQTQDDLLNNRIRFETECPDDEILQTCLQIRSTQNTVVLFTFDKNLCNKATAYNIMSIGRNDELDKLDNLPVDENNSISSLRTSLEKKDNELSFANQELKLADEIFEDAKDVMKNFLTKVVSTEMEILFENNWQRHVIIKPPWSVVDVLKCAIKHWMAAVSEAFYRRPESLVKELLQAFGTNLSNGRKLQQVGGVLEKCGDLIEMVHREKYCNLMVHSSNQIDVLKKKCISFEKDLSKRRLLDEIEIYYDPQEQETRAEQGFSVFDKLYCHARDVCGTLTERVGRPCNFLYKKWSGHSSSNEVQTITATNVHNVLIALSNVLQNTDDLDSNYTAIKKVFEALVHFSLDIYEHNCSDQFEKLTLTDVYYCLKLRERLLRDGLRQFQELSIHFCKLATYRCT